MPRRRRQQGLERVLGAPALFATVYGNVGSSIYYALGVTAVFALGLTPLVFAIAGVIFAATTLTYAEGTVRYPEAGGSSSFARHAFNEVVSFGAAWAQMLNYVITISISAFFVPHYLSIFWEPLKTNPWDIIVGAIVIVLLVALNIVGIQEAAKLNVTLAFLDFGTQLLLVLLGFYLVFSPSILIDNIHWGTAPTWSNFALAIPVAMIAYTGIETASNLAEEARDPARNIPRAYLMTAIAVFAIYLTLPAIALSALPVKHIAGRLRRRCSRCLPDQGGFKNDPVLGVVENLGLSGTLLDVLQVYVGVLAATILFIATNAGRDRRIADHVRDGELPAASRGLQARAPALQDSVGLARLLRGDRLDHGAASRGRSTSSGRCTRSARCSRSRSRTCRWSPCARSVPTPSSSSAAGRTSASAASTGRSSRSSAGSPPGSRGSSSWSRPPRRAMRASAGSPSASRCTSSTGGGSCTRR